MEKIVVHGNDGKILKGHTSDFSTHRPYFHLVTIQRPFDSEKVWLANQKGIFFVKDFSGNPSHIDIHFWRSTHESGRPVVVTFKDGEKIYGQAELEEDDHRGFFIYPVDPVGNNKKAYVMNSFIESVQIAE